MEIRKKALITLKHVYQLDEDLIPNVDEELRSAISDKDPIVVSAALQFFVTLIKVSPLLSTPSSTLLLVVKRLINSLLVLWDYTLFSWP